jgi:hypothetical protein
VVGITVTHTLRVTEQKIDAVLMRKGDAEICTNDTESTFGPIECEFRRPPSVPPFPIELASKLNDFFGPMGPERMSLKDGEAISPNPHLLRLGVQMPVMNNRSIALIDKNLEISVTRRAEAGLNHATKACAGLGNEPTLHPRSR